MENYHISSGSIILQRAERDFRACFCFIRGTLPTLAGNLQVLHPAEKAYYEQLKFDRRKESYLLGRIAAKTAIANLLEIDEPGSFHIDFGIFQFPVVNGPVSQPVQTSISHCNDIGLALAFPEAHPLGVDIEQVNGQRIKAMQTMVSPTELALLEPYNIPPATGYTLGWTVKEGLSKVLRTGLTSEFSLFEIKSIAQENDLYISTFRHYNQYKAVSCNAGNYVCSVIVPGKTTPQLEAFLKCFRDIVSA